MADEGRADASNDTREHTEPRWGLFMPLFTAGFCPAKTARRTDHLSGFDSFLTHVVAWLGLLGVLGGALAWNDGRIARLYGLMPWELEDILFSLTCAEVFYLLSALLLTPWGAQRERIRTSIYRSLHRALRHTPHAVQAFLLASVIAAPFYWVRAEYQTALWYEVNTAEDELIHNGVPPSTAWSQAREIVRDRYPFHVIHGEELGSITYYVGGLWFLWGLLAAVGAAPRKSDAEGYPPLCEDCGYNLTGLSMEGRCPECGEHIANSLGLDARPGTHWQQRSTFGRWDGFWKTAGAALVAPTALGRRMIPSPGKPDHRSLMVIWCGGFFALTWLGCVAFHVADSDRASVLGDEELLWFSCPAVSYFFALAALFINVSSAGIVGLLSSWKHKRNMLPATMQAACAAGGFLLIWLVLAFSGWAIITAANEYLFRHSYRTFAIVFGICLSAGPSLVCWFTYLWLIARIARGARFANA